MRGACFGLVIGGALSLAVAGSPAAAHHSFAMIDATKTVTLSGTVKEFRWTNPHAWVRLEVRDPRTGRDVEWMIEGMGPNGLTRQGWSRGMARPGDKAIIEIHPLKDGSAGGALMTMTVGGRKYLTHVGP